jgi:Zn finger protein HypA/HybF involved in hydrogenase expression
MISMKGTIMAMTIRDEDPTRECDHCGKSFSYDLDCMYSDSLYSCPECTKEMMEQEPSLYVKCVKCGDIHYTHHVGVDRVNHLCRYCSKLPLE